MTAVDTNISRWCDSDLDPALRTTSRRSVKKLYQQGERLLCFPQNLVEFRNVAPRPATANGLGLSPEQAARYVDRFQTLLRLLPETPDIFPAWRNLVLQQRLSGIHVHDSRIAAAMIVHQVPRILTFDVDDFKRYTKVSVVDPRSV